MMFLTGDHPVRAKKIRLSVRGLEYLSQQELNREQLGALLKVLDDKVPLIQLLEEKEKQSEASVSIGRENGSEALNDCAIISATIYLRGRSMGTVAILGSKRMRYAKVLPTIRQAAQIISSVLNDLNWDSLF